MADGASSPFPAGGLPASRFEVALEPPTPKEKIAFIKNYVHRFIYIKYGVSGERTGRVRPGGRRLLRKGRGLTYRPEGSFLVLVSRPSPAFLVSGRENSPRLPPNVSTSGRRSMSGWA